MHMADALISTPVALVAGVGAASLLVVASRKVSKIKRADILPLMGVMGAFVFAAQMINFSIPGTGSSGHIIGGILLAALLGPWAAFLTLASVIIIQCLIFADGGLMALGCNLINMGVMTTMVAYPLIYRPIAKATIIRWRIMLASVLACIVGLEAGALAVTLETELSGVTQLPYVTFLSFMLPIHLLIGLCEGVATGLVLCFIASYRPAMLASVNTEYKDTEQEDKKSKSAKWILAILSAVALIFAVSFSWLASSDPDGLEWSIEKITGNAELAPTVAPPTAIIPDYDSTFSGVIGGLIVVALIWGICIILFRSKKSVRSNKN
ncbi:MAG: cobalamin biosynthesis protein CbiM [Bacteroides sp.]|nr:cobalamin biosynthesis protein CbiM [Bacteroides sp.]